MSEKKSNKLLFGILIGIVIAALISLIVIVIASPFNFEESEANKDAPEITDKEIADKTEDDLKDQPSANLPPNEDKKPNEKPTTDKDEKQQDSSTTPPTVIKKDIEIKDTDHIRGDKNAPITIVEYSDFQCPYCVQFHNAMNEAMQNYDGKVRWIYRHFPLKSHPSSAKAAEASECAAEQNKFWEYNDALFKKQKDIENGIFTEIAKELGLNTNNFEECLNSGKYKEKVEAEYNEGKSFGVSGTPGNFINGQKLRGAMPYDMLKEEIDKLL